MDSTLLSDDLRYKNALKGDIPEHLETCMEIIQEIDTPHLESRTQELIGVKEQVIIGALVTGQVPPQSFIKGNF